MLFLVRASRGASHSVDVNPRRPPQVGEQASLLLALGLVAARLLPVLQLALLPAVHHGLAPRARQSRLLDATPPRTLRGLLPRFAPPHWISRCWLGAASRVYGYGH